MLWQIKLSFIKKNKLLRGIHSTHCLLNRALGMEYHSLLRSWQSRWHLFFSHTLGYLRKGNMEGICRFRRFIPQAKQTSRQPLPTSWELAISRVFKRICFSRSCLWKMDRQILRLFTLKHLLKHSLFFWLRQAPGKELDGKMCLCLFHEVWRSERWRLWREPQMIPRFDWKSWLKASVSA